MLKTHLAQVCAAIVAGIGRSKRPVQVILTQGKQAFTTGSVVVVPQTEEWWILLGYLFHEIGHILHTDFEIFASTASDPVLKSLLNVIEDPRIEMEMAKVYPGAKGIMNRLWRMLGDQGRLIPQDHNPQKVMIAFVRAKMRQRVSGNIADIVAEIEALAEVCFGRSLLDQADLLLGRMPNSTEEALAIAKEILALMSSIETRQDGEEGEGATQEGSGDEQAVDDHPGDDNPDDQSPDGEESEDDSSEDQRSDEPSAEDQAAGESDVGTEDASEDAIPGQSGPEDPNGSEHPNEQGAGDVANQDAFDLGELLRLSMGWETASKAPYLPSGIVIENSAAGAEEALMIHRSLVADVGSSIEDMLQSQVLQPVARALSGKLSKRSVHRLFTDKRAFMRRARSLGMDTHLHVLVDMSGSMDTNVTHDTRMVIAQQSVLALLMACRDLDQASVSAFGFSGQDSELRLTVLNEQTGRLEPMGNTPTGQAMLASEEIFPSDKDRRVMLVVTDGEPDLPHRDVTEALEGRGIEVYGFGIEVREELLDKNFNRYVSVQDGRIGKAFRDLALMILTS